MVRNQVWSTLELSVVDVLFSTMAKNILENLTLNLMKVYFWGMILTLPPTEFQ